MSSFGNAFSGTVGGASTGAGLGSFFGPPGTAIGAGIGAGVGLISGLFSQSDEEIRKQRYDDMVKRLNELRSRGAERINKFRSSGISRMEQGAARRALAMGQSGESDSLALPGVSQIETQASDSMSRYMDAIDAQKIAAEQDFANRPIEPNVSDYLMELGNTGLSYMQNQEYIKNMYPKTEEQQSIGSSSPGIGSVYPQNSQNKIENLSNRTMPLLGEKFDIPDTQPNNLFRNYFSKINSTYPR